MKLEVGKFIRTPYGIRKILNEFEEGYELDRCLHYCYPEGHDLYKEDLENDDDKIVTKSSFNIIDILEVGDYVNGYKVTGIDGTYHGRKDIAIYCDYQENEKTGKWIMIYDDEIKSVITHEQMEQMAYKVGK